MYSGIMLNANDDYLLLEGGGQNSILHNTFTEDGILIQNSNNQIITGNTITDAPDNGIKSLSLVRIIIYQIIQFRVQMMKIYM